MTRHVRVVLFCLLTLSPAFAHGEVIDFEMIPGQGAPIDDQLISDEFEADFGVTFVLLENDGMPADPSIGPRIAGIGGPKTAFVGPSRDSACDQIGSTTNDTVLDEERAGCWMLTDDGVHPGPRPFGLLIAYTDPVLEASGELIDVDNGPEGWRITALDENDDPIVHPDNPFVIEFPGPGTGDGEATIFAFDMGIPIHAIELIYIGEDSFGRGLAFDNFSPASLSADVPPGDESQFVNRLFQNAPNPLNPGTEIAFSLARRSHAEVRIYAASGRLVRMLLSRQLSAGPHRLSWNGLADDGREVGAGTFFYILRIDGRAVETRKAAVLR